MKGLDEQVQEVKSDVLSIAAELARLEEWLLYPSARTWPCSSRSASATRCAWTRCDPIDGQLVAHSIYSFKELEALQKGGVQRIYTGNVPTGEHQIELRSPASSTPARSTAARSTSRSARASSRSSSADGWLGATAARRLVTSMPARLHRRTRAGGCARRGSLREQVSHDLYFGEALDHAHQGHFFEALQRLDAELAQHRGLDEPGATRCIFRSATPSSRWATSS